MSLNMVQQFPAPLQPCTQLPKPQCSKVVCSWNPHHLCSQVPGHPLTRRVVFTLSLLLFVAVYVCKQPDLFICTVVVVIGSMSPTHQYVELVVLADDRSL